MQLIIISLALITAANAFSLGFLTFSPPLFPPKLHRKADLQVLKVNKLEEKITAIFDEFQETLETVPFNHIQKRSFSRNYKVDSGGNVKVTISLEPSASAARYWG